MNNDVAEATVERITFDEPRASYRIINPIRDRLGREGTKDLNSRLYDALEHFPSLQGETITVGWLHPKADAGARAFGHNRLICLKGDKYTSNVTLYHELGHVAIWVRNENGEDHPETSEEYCSIFSMARMPPKSVDEQRVPYLGKSELDTERFPEICQRALDYREDHRNYIQKCKEWLKI